MSHVPAEAWKQAIGFGVAGNMTGHLEQAGEAGDFVDVKTASASAPKGMFPFYIPGATGALGVFPVSCDRLVLPEGGGTVQIEPEVVLDLTLNWSDDGLVSGVRVHAMAAYNDASIRRQAPKISAKKNWGAATKGVASTWIALDGLQSGGFADRFQLASFLHRGDTLHAYGEDCPVSGYSYFHQTLLDWIVDRLNHQQDHGPLEHLAEHLATAGRPKRALISIGATRYTDFGETHFLQPGDESVVVVYDGTVHSAEAVYSALAARADATLTAASVLRQAVE